MKDAQKPDHVSLNTLIGRLKEGRFQVPNFQREFEWKPSDIRDLMRSIFLDYYIGSLLLWKGKKENFDALSCEPLYGYTGDRNPEHIILDGQQRLTAMYYAFLAPAKELPHKSSRAIFYIRVDKFMAEEYDQAFHYDWVTRNWKKILADRNIQFQEHIFPLSIVGASGWELPNWVQEYEQFWRNEAETSTNGSSNGTAAEHAQNAKAFGSYLKALTEQYQIAYIELDRDLDIAKVCDIFTQINSKGVRLDAFDLINALLTPKNLSLKQMWHDARSKLEFVDTDRMNVYVLQVMSILRQTYLSSKYLYYLLPGQEKPVRDGSGKLTKQVLVSDSDDFKALWNTAVKALESSINQLRQPQEFGAIAARFLPYDAILPVFAALQAHVKSLPPARRLDAQRKIRHWYWASVFTNRYSSAVESTSARDFLALKAWFDDDDAQLPVLVEFNEQFRNLDLRQETNKGTAVYKGIFNLFVLQGARDWMTGNIPQHDELDDHHIIPQAWGKKHLKGDSVHTILNRTPLTAETNRHVINDDLPNKYLPRMIRENGEQVVRNVLESHFISPAAQAILMRDPFTSEDFDAFIAERNRTIQDAIENLLIKERLDLEPHLRELDSQVEQVELALRQLIVTALGNDSAKLPQQVFRKTDERIASALRKNPGLDGDQMRTLAGRLEHADLRELQDTIMNNGLWSLFEQRFVSKDTLNLRFGQLAELRNGIRHSRSVNEIVRKEGEAAILWFKQVLGIQ